MSKEQLYKRLEAGKTITGIDTADRHLFKVEMETEIRDYQANWRISAGARKVRRKQAASRGNHDMPKVPADKEATVLHAVPPKWGKTL
jgi:hypothetical protein